MREQLAVRETAAMWAALGDLTQVTSILILVLKRQAHFFVYFPPAHYNYIHKITPPLF